MSCTALDIDAVFLPRSTSKTRKVRTESSIEELVPGATLAGSLSMVVSKGAGAGESGSMVCWNVLVEVVASGESRAASFGPVGTSVVFSDNRLPDVVAIGEQDSDPESLGVGSPRSKFSTRALFDRLGEGLSSMSAPGLVFS